MDGVTAERWSGKRNWGGKNEGKLIRMRSKRPNDQKRTEPNEGGGFGETLSAYGAGEDDARILNAGPEPATRPPGASGPGGRQAGDGNEKPVRYAQRNGGVEDGLGVTVHGTQGAGLEGCSLDVDTEQLIAERVHGTDARLQGGELTTLGEGRIGGKGEWTGWDGTIQPGGVVR
jgi:hypothetical protein